VRVSGCSGVGSAARGITDEEFAAYCAAKPHNVSSLDGLPALPLPLPALPVPARPRAAT